MAKLVFKLFSVCTVATTLHGADPASAQERQAEIKGERALNSAGKKAIVQHLKAQMRYLQEQASAYPIPEKQIKSFVETNMTKTEYDSYAKRVKEENELIQMTNRVLATYTKHEPWFMERLNEIRTKD